MIVGLSWTALASLVVLDLLLDWMLGEPRRWHPLVGFGRLANLLECTLNRRSSAIRYGGGAVGWMLAVLPLTLLSY